MRGKWIFQVILRPPPTSPSPTACQSSCATCSSSLDCQSCGSQLPLLSADSGQCLASCPTGSYQHDHTHCRREYRSLSHGLTPPPPPPVATVDVEVAFWLRFTRGHLGDEIPAALRKLVIKCLCVFICLEAEFSLRLMRLGWYDDSSEPRLFVTIWFGVSLS